MPLYVINGISVLFVHVPKTGGTSLEHGLRQAGSEFLFEHDFFKRQERIAACSLQHLHWSALSAIVPPGQVDAVFTVVRNPVSRLVSEFRFRLGLKPSSRAKTCKAEFGEEPREFSDWLSFALKNRRNDPFMFDNHLRPQVEFVGSEVRVFRLEDGLHHVAEWLRDVTSFDVALPERRRQRSKGPKVVPAPEDIRLIQNAYAADFETFDYSTDREEAKTAQA